MTASNWLIRWLRYAISLFVAAGITYVVHEVAHFVACKALGYSAIIDWKYGSVLTCDASGNVIPDSLLPPIDGILTLLAGPFATLLLAAGFTILYLKVRGSFLLFAIAILSSVSRLNIVVDGFNSDEGSISNIMLSSMGRTGRMMGLVVPLIVWTASIVLSSILVSRQSFFKRTYWAIPLWVIVGFAFLISLRILMVALL